MQQAGIKRKYEAESSSGEEESSDETWTPGSSCSSQQEMQSPRPIVHTRSKGAAEQPPAQADAAMESADAVVDNESDLSSDTEEDESEDEEDSYDEEEEEEESDEDDDYSDDDSFVTSNEDADREEREEVIRSYRKVFGETADDEEGEDANLIEGHFMPAQPPEEDLSVGGVVAGTDEL